jgi:hypothetical protein
MIGQERLRSDLSEIAEEGVIDAAFLNVAT